MTTPATPTATPPTPESTSALGRCVGDAAAFLEHRFTVGLNLFRGTGFDDLLSLVDVDRQLTGGGLRRPSVRLVRDGVVLDPASWTRRARTGAAVIDDLVDPGRALELFAGGATVVLQAMHRWWPPLTRFCADLELALGHHTQANAYLTPAGAAGLSPHHDTHDVFVMQVAGTKRWAVREPLLEAPLARHRCDHDAAARQPVVTVLELRPGDCLYLPRGHIHSATAQVATSLHLTIGVLATTAHDVLRRLVERAAEEPVFRRTLPPAFVTSPEVGGAVVGDVVGHLMEWLGELDSDVVADDLRRRFWAGRRPVLEGQLLELEALGSIGDRSVVRRRAAITCRLEESPEGLVMTLGDRRLHLPAATATAVRLLVDGSAHRVSELADLLDRPSRAVLVRRLVREGVLQHVEPAVARAT